MIRPLLTEIAIFLIPFAVYALFLAATRVGVVSIEAWPFRVVATLTAVALALLVGSFLFLAHYAGAPPGSTYVPAHMEKGRLVPGAGSK
ncbi:MAG: hypothetical protein EPO23_01280 [Xanthobacteraceae bacterium]|nr:MAG: hypothetical protein EPO23_01280 [Xanthobacteraceae bacterium]